MEMRFGADKWKVMVVDGKEDEVQEKLIVQTFPCKYKIARKSPKPAIPRKYEIAQKSPNVQNFPHIRNTDTQLSQLTQPLYHW